MRQTLALVLGLSATLAFGQSGKTVVTILDYEAQPDGPGPRALWDEVRAQVPGIELKIESAFSDAYFQRLDWLAQNRSLPDLVFSWPAGRTAPLLERGVFRDISPYFSPEELARFTPEALNLSHQSAGYLAILPPGLTAAHVLYVNTKLLSSLGLKPAATYEELVAQVPVLARQGLETVLMDNWDDWVLGACLFSTVLSRMAGTDWPADLREGRRSFTEPVFVEAVAFMQRLYRDGVLSPAALRTGYNEVAERFRAGKGAYLVDGDWRWSLFEDMDGVRMAVFPRLPGELPGAVGTSYALGPGYGLNASIPVGSAQEKAAVAVLKALQSARTQRVRLAWRSSFPSRLDVGSEGLSPLARERLEFSRRQTGGPIFDNVVPPSVFQALFSGLDALIHGTSTPEAVADRVEQAVVLWRADLTASP